MGFDKGIRWLQGKSIIIYKISSYESNPPPQRWHWNCIIFKLLNEMAVPLAVPLQFESPVYLYAGKAFSHIFRVL